jgi:hypothetical protein
MPDFNSPAFRRQQAAPQKPPMREFNVGIEEDLPEAPQVPPQLSTVELEAQVKAARQEKAELLKSGPRITDHAKRRIELLAGIGRLTKDIKIADTVFTLRTLKSRETKEAMMDTLANVKSDLEAGFEARKHQLVRALYKIDGADIDEVLGTSDPEAKLELIDDLEEVTVAKLWDELAALKEEAKTKYGITTAKVAEEVASDLKK